MKQTVGAIQIRSRIGQIAAGMLDGSVHYLEGSIELASLRHDVGAYENDPDFLPFILETAVGCFDSRYGHDMHTKICEFLRTLWVISKTLHGFSKNLKAAGRRYHSWQGLRPLPASDALPATLRFPDNSVPNCGF